MKTILLATAALFAAAAPAVAQDATQPADAAAPAYDPAAAAPAASNDPAASPVSATGSSFAGPRAEFFGGWNRTRNRNRATVNGVSANDSVHSDSALVGALGGYDFAVGDKLIVGAFGSYALNTLRECSNAAAPALRGCLKGGREIEGGGRVGFKTLDDKALLYAKGAYVNSQLRGKFATVGGIDRESKNLTGWRAGAGVEYALNKNFYTKVEYDYTKFGSIDSADIGLPGARLRQDRNQVLGGFGIRF